MKIANTFFMHESYCNHRSYLPPKLPQMLDVFAISQRGFARTRDCKTYEGIPSDHEAIELRLSLTVIKHTGEKKTSTGLTDWEAIKNDSAKRSFSTPASLS